jgi:hypothetical protein
MSSTAGGALLVMALTLACCGSSGSSAEGTEGTEGTGVRGRVLDETCFGPCAPGTTTRLYSGEASVSVKRLPGRHRVATAIVDEGRFRKRLDPGRYRLRARIADPCWESDPTKVRVRPGQFKRAKLLVRNDCVR